MPDLFWALAAAGSLLLGAGVLLRAAAPYRPRGRHGDRLLTPAEVKHVAAIEQISALPVAIDDEPTVALGPLDLPANPREEVPLFQATGRQVEGFWRRHPGGLENTRGWSNAQLQDLVQAVRAARVQEKDDAE